MVTKKIYRTEAIVLKHVDSGEADRILTLLTPDLGKLRAIARGVRKLKSKLGGHLEPLTRCQLMLARGRNLDTVTQAELLESFSSQDLRQVAYGIYLLELVDSFVVEGEGDRDLYELLLQALRELRGTLQAELLCRYFEMHFLDQVGFRPELEHCLSCKSRLRPEVNFFSPSGGGVLCPQCKNTEPLAWPLSLDCLKVMRFLQRSDYSAVARLRLSPGLFQELERLVHGYLRYLLERELKSADFLARLKPASPP